MRTEKLIKIARTTDIPEGGRGSFEVSDKMIVVFNVKGKFYAVDDFCPHMSAPLSEGELEGLRLTCIWHEYQFDLESGECLSDDAAALIKYPVRVEGDDLLIAV